MKRFLLFVGLLVAAAYMLTEPPAGTQTVMSATEAPARPDKPLLTSWGPTLGSLRGGVSARRAPATTDSGAQTEVASKFRKYGPKTELWVLGKSNGWTEPTDPVAQDQGWASDSYIETASIVPPAQQVAEASVETARDVKPEPRPKVRVAAVQEESRPAAKPAEPVIDRIAAARPPQMRGLFSKSKPKTVTRASEPRRGRGLLAIFRGRNKPAQRVFALGPAR